MPLVIRMATGAGRQVAAQHSHSLEGWYAHVPGLTVLAPATPQDARDMLLARAARARPGDRLRARRCSTAPRVSSTRTAAPAPIRGAAIRRAGRDVTLVTYGGSLRKALAAAERLAADGVEAEVIDLRALRPLDTATVLGVGRDARTAR